jgi:hypothetical protein
MHKLRGAAGMLGAKLIQDLAAEAEATASAGELELSAHLAARLAAEMQRLVLSAAPTIEAQRVATAPALAVGDDELDPLLVVELVNLLRQQNLAAADHFAAIGPQLQRRLGQVSYALVRDHVADLRFADAAQLLEGTGALV